MVSPGLLDQLRILDRQFSNRPIARRKGDNWLTKSFVSAQRSELAQRQKFFREDGLGQQAVLTWQRDTHRLSLAGTPDGHGAVFRVTRSQIDASFDRKPLTGVALDLQRASAAVNFLIDTPVAEMTWAEATGVLRIVLMVLDRTPRRQLSRHGRQFNPCLSSSGATDDEVASVLHKMLSLEDHPTGMTRLEKLEAKAGDLVLLWKDLWKYRDFNMVCGRLRLNPKNNHVVWAFKPLPLYSEKYRAVVRSLIDAHVRNLLKAQEVSQPDNQEEIAVDDQKEISVDLETLARAIGQEWDESFGYAAADRGPVYQAISHTREIFRRHGVCIAIRAYSPGSYILKKFREYEPIGEKLQDRIDCNR